MFFQESLFKESRRFVMRRVVSLSVVCSLFIIALLAAGLTTPAFASSARITQAIDESKVVQLFGNTRPEARNRANDRGPVSDSFDADHIFLLLQRSPEQEEALDKLIDELNDRKSANFHHWLTPEQYGEYGVAQEDIDKVVGWLEYHGFRINQVYPNHILIDFSGTAGQIKAAFHTEIHQLEVEGQQHVANVSDPQIPAALAPVVKGLSSLNDFKPHPMYKKKTDYTFAGCGLPSSPSTCYAVTPADNQTIYNLNPVYNAGYSGQGQTIALVEDTDTYGTAGSNGTSDWNTYRSTFGLSTAFPLGSYTITHPGGCTDPGTNGDDGEAAIDVEVATAIAPSAAIELIACPSTTFSFGGQIALQNMINASGPYPGVVSVSYGQCEALTGQGMNALFYSTYQQAATQGISVFVSAGDEGPSSCSNEFSAGTEYDVTSLGVTGWGETPYNVAVGGTDFEDTYFYRTGGAPLTTYWSSSNSSNYGSALSYIPEIPWNDSCASALISKAATGSFTPYGASPATCNNSSYDTSSTFLIAAAGSGGASNCATGAAGTSQSSYLITASECRGYAKPSWQSGTALAGGAAVYGQPSDGVRDIPDVSMFAANGIWGHFEIVCWSDPAYTADGSASCTGAPSTWAGFGGTSVAAPTMAAVQALVNQKTGDTWGNPNPIYYQIGQNQYGTAGGTFLGSGCNSTTGNTAGCAFNDVTQGDIDLACEDNGTTEEAHCYLPATTPSRGHGVDSTDNITAAAVINGGTGYTSAPTCTIAGPSNNNPYLSPTGTTLWAGGTQATCTASVSSATTTAKWTIAISSASAAGQAITFTSNSGAVLATYTLSGSSTTAIATALAASINGGSFATATTSSATVTATAKTAGYAGNFNVSWGNGWLDGPDYVVITNTTVGQGPNYVSGITITAAGSGYQPDTPITLTGGGGTGAIAVANTSPGTAAQSYQPSYGAAPGWDMATGLGTPNAYNLVNSSVWTGAASITCTGVPSSAAYSSTFVISCTDGASIPVAYYASSGSCSNSGATYTITSGTGTCTVTAGIAQGSPTVTYSVSATPATPVVTLSNLTQTYTGSPLSPTCTVVPSSLSSTLTGAPDTNANSYPVTCTTTATSNYSSGSASGTFTINPATATIAFSNLSQEYNGTALSPTVTTTPSGLSYSSTGFPDTNAGSYPVTATITNPNYTGSTSGTFVITPAVASLSVTSSSANNTSTYGQSVTFTATVTTDTGEVKGRKTKKVRPMDVNGQISWNVTGCNPSTVSGASGQTATCTTSSLQGGSDTVTATYTANDGNHNSTASGSVTQTVNPAANTVTFTTPAPASAEYNSSFTVAAAGLGTGAITYTSDGVVCSNSGATYTMLEGSGTCTVTASQAADNNYQTGSASESVTATNAQTTVNVATSGSPSNYGQSVTFTATLTSNTGLVRKRNTHRKPLDITGNVTWTADTGCGNTAVTWSSANQSATATCTTSVLPVGSDTVTASYAGDANHGSGSGQVTQAVNGGVATAISVTSVSPASEDYGSTAPVTVSATLSWTGSGAAPTASDVTFSGNGSGTFGAATCGTASGDAMTCTATYTPANDAAGTYTFVAAFSGDSNYAASTSAQTNNFTINVATTTTTVTSSLNPSTYATPVTFTATIGAENNFVKGRRNTRKKPMDVTGNVAWSANTGCGSTAATWDPVNLVATATCTTSRASSLEVGNDTVTATYAGDANHSGSSGSIVQVIQGGIPTTISVTGVSPAAEDYAANSAVTITALLSWTGNGVAPTAADVTIGGNGTGTYGATTCAARVHETMTCTATYTPNNDAAGTYTETAAFSGDSNYAASTSAQTNNFTINPATTTTAVTSSQNPSTYAQPVTFTATIGAENNFVKGHRNSRKPMDVTGNVTWSGNTGCGTTAATWDPVNLVATATCTTSRASSLEVGNDTVTATYSGDANHSGSSGSVVQAIQGGIATTIDVTNVSPASEAYAANSAVTITALLTWTGNGVAPTAANVTIGGNGHGTYGATSCAARVHETMTCTATYTPNNSDVVGSYTETATFSGDANYTASSSSETNNFAISKATATVTLSNLSQTYTGSALTPTVTTTPAGLSYNLTGAPDTNAGSYSVTATITDANYAGTASGTFIINKAAATVALSNLTQTYTGAALSPTVTTTPSGLSYSLTGAPDTNGGSYPVTATVTDPNYSGTASGTFVINKASQTITLTGAPVSAIFGTSFTVTATASSSLIPAFTATGGCTVVDNGNGTGTYKMTSGTTSCLVTASQAGNGNYTAAASVNKSVTAAKATQTITVTQGAPGTAPYGETFTLAGTAPGGTVTYGAAGACTVSSGTYTITATSGTCYESLSQAGNANYYAAPTVAQSTKVAAAVAPTVSFTGAPTSAAYGTPFTVTATSNEVGNQTSTPVIKSGTTTICSVGNVSVSGATATATVTMLAGSGTCDLTATWAVNNAYKAASVTQKTTAERITPTVSFMGAPASAAKGTTITVTATSNESGANAAVPTITATPSTVCSVSSSSSSGTSAQATVTIKAATGTCTTKASWAVTTEYAAETLTQSTAAN
jgi:hypothetical protein